MRMPWQTAVLLGLETISMVYSLCAMIPLLFRGGQGLAPWLTGLLVSLLLLVIQAVMLACICRGRKAGWGIAIAIWAIDAAMLPIGGYLLLSGAIPAIRISLLFKVLGYGYLIFCGPTRAYFGVGRAREAAERKSPPGQMFARLSARLHNEEYTPLEEPFPVSPEADPATHTDMDLWLEEAGRLEPQLHLSEAEGDCASALLEGLLPPMPEWARESCDVRQLFQRCLSRALRELDEFSAYPREAAAGDEITIVENTLLLIVTVNQTRQDGPYHAAADLRVNWEPAT